MARTGRVALVGQPEVEDHDPPGALDQDVRRLEIAVDALGAVDRLEPIDELPERRAQPIEIDRAARQRVIGPVAAAAAHPAHEVLAEDELHRDHPLAAILDQLVEPHDVGVVQVGEQPELGLEREQRAGLERVQALDRDLLAGAAIAGAADHAHRAGAQLVEHLEVVQGGGHRACTSIVRPRGRAGSAQAP